MFGGSGSTTGQGRPNAEGVFADVFEEVGPQASLNMIDTHDTIHLSYYGQRLSAMRHGGAISEPYAEEELASSLQMYLA